MGTRHLTIVAAAGGYPVAQYGQWDGYPSGQGVTALNFLKTLTPEQRAEFKAKCLATGTATEAELKAELKEKGIVSNNGWMIQRMRTNSSPRTRSCHGIPAPLSWS